MNRQMLVFAVGVMLMATSCKSTKEKNIATVYTVTSPEITSTFIAKDYVASIQSEKNTEIRAQKDGLLQDIYVDEGQTVAEPVMEQTGSSLITKVAVCVCGAIQALSPSHT